MHMNRIELLRRYGINRPNDLVLKCGMKRQQAQQILFYGCGIGKRVAVRIQEAIGCPMLDLMMAEAEPRTPQRVRRKTRLKGTPGPVESCEVA
jgi:hypothetical protein